MPGEPDLFAVTSAAVRADEQRRDDPVVRGRIRRFQRIADALHLVLTVVAPPPLSRSLAFAKAAAIQLTLGYVAAFPIILALAFLTMFW